MATLNFPDDPTTGDVYKDGNSGFSYEWNGTVWISTDPSTASNIREIDDISSGFDGSDTTFTLQVAGVNVEPTNAQQLIISVGGVMQNAGQDFTVSGSTLTFTTAPSASLTFFGVLLGTALSLNTVADGTVGSSSLKTEDFTIGGSGNTVTIPGNLTVQGTETIINTERLDIQDKTVGIASTNAPTSTSQDDAGIVIYGQTQITALYDVDKAALGISTAVNVAGVVTATEVNATTRLVATAATVGLGVTINNTGIDAGNAGIVTAGTLAAPAVMALKTGGTERLRINATNGRVGIKTDSPGSLLQVSGKSSLYGVGEAAVEWGDTSALGSLSWTATAGDPIVRANSGKDLVFHTDGANERLRITSAGGFRFSNGLFDEKVNITAGKLSANQDIDLADGMVHYFTTTEDTTALPNIRINGSTTLQSAMDTGDVCTVTLITTAAAAGYSAHVTIDSVAVTEEWVGGTAPAAGSADGLDIYTYTIICIGTGTGDSGFKVIANRSNAT